MKNVFVQLFHGHMKRNNWKRNNSTAAKLQRKTLCDKRKGKKQTFLGKWRGKGRKSWWQKFVCFRHPRERNLHYLDLPFPRARLGTIYLATPLNSSSSLIVTHVCVPGLKVEACVALNKKSLPSFYSILFFVYFFLLLFCIDDPIVLFFS